MYKQEDTMENKQAMDTGSWEQVENISTQELDNAVADMVLAQSQYDTMKNAYLELQQKRDEAREVVLSLLKRAGKTKYYAEGLGTASVVTKYAVQTPKDSESKAKLLAYFKDQGEEVFLEKVGVNYQSLNAWVNQELEKDPSFIMPGVGAPTATEELRFRK